MGGRGGFVRAEGLVDDYGGKVGRSNAEQAARFQRDRFAASENPAGRNRVCGTGILVGPGRLAGKDAVPNTLTVTRPRRASETKPRHYAASLNRQSPTRALPCRVASQACLNLPHYLTKSTNFVNTLWSESIVLANTLHPEADPLDDRRALPNLPSRAIIAGPCAPLRILPSILCRNARKVKEIPCWQRALEAPPPGPCWSSAFRRSFRGNSA